MVHLYLEVYKNDLNYEKQENKMKISKTMQTILKLLHNNYFYLVKPIILDIIDPNL